MTITDRAAESVSRLVANVPTCSPQRIEAMMRCFLPPDGRELTGAQLAVHLANYACKLESVAVALAADTIAEDEAQRSLASIPEGL